MNRYEILLPVKHEKNKDNFISLKLGFNKETIHWATSQTKEKGYEVIAKPVQKTGFSTSFGAFTGFYEIIYPVQRQSSKRFEEAKKILEANIPKYKEHFEQKGYQFLNTES